MKKTLPVLLLCCFQTLGIQAQTHSAPDTILIQTFSVDPSDTMLTFPNGNDQQWVNWDADNLTTLCGIGVIVPGNWYWESDLGDLNNPPINSAFTSCSYFVDTTQTNENWLITPPIYIPDSATVLQWRSLSYQGPAYMDGYKVLVSTSTNEPFTGAFTDTLFKAAEMHSRPTPLTLNPDNYVFSPGYIHANRYTDTAYYFLITPNAGAYTGRLEPHIASLEAYAGQTIYIAFLHDSTNDFLLQIDDITVIHGKTISTSGPGIQNYFLQILPNPAAETTTLSWKFQTRQAGRLIVRNLFGQAILEQHINDLSIGALQLDTQSFPVGIYPCSLQTALGQQTILLVKR